MDKNLSNSYLGNVDISASEIEEMDLEVTHSEGSQLITFILGDEKYGMEILKVRELISHPEGLTRIPGMPDFIVGMFGRFHINKGQLELLKNSKNIEKYLTRW